MSIFETAASYPLEAELSLSRKKSEIARVLPGNRKLESEISIVAEQGDGGYFWSIQLSENLKAEIDREIQHLTSKLTTNGREVLEKIANYRPREWGIAYHHECGTDIYIESFEGSPEIKLGFVADGDFDILKKLDKLTKYC